MVFCAEFESGGIQARSHDGCAPRPWSTGPIGKGMSWSPYGEGTAVSAQLLDCGQAVLMV
jgi:hypothetical protein